MCVVRVFRSLHFDLVILVVRGVHYSCFHCLYMSFPEALRMTGIFLH